MMGCMAQIVTPKQLTQADRSIARAVNADLIAAFEESIARDDPRKGRKVAYVKGASSERCGR